jgi:hypothetical protein
MKLSVRGKRIKTRTIIALVAAIGMIGGAAAIAPHLKSSQQIRQVDFSSSASSPQSVKLTCSNWNAALGFWNWDILVQLNPDGTAASAAALGDAYTSGVSPAIATVERTDPATITIDNSGHHLHFAGSALIQWGLGQVVFSGPPNTCNADFSFPNPQSPVIHLQPSS